MKPTAAHAQTLANKAESMYTKNKRAEAFATAGQHAIQPQTMNKPTITVEMRAQYGAPAYFPVCPAAQTFAAIAKTKTLTPQAIAQIKTLGYTVTVKHPEPTI